MTHNGPFAGPPSQPWSGRGSSDEPYTEPADPWGDHPTAPPASSGWHSSPAPAEASSLPPLHTGTSAPLNTPPPVWGHQPQQRPGRRNGRIVALVAVLGLLICGGLGVAAWLLISNMDKPDSNATAPRTTGVSTPNGGVADPPQPASSEDARFVKEGQCVRNEGNADQPVMKVVSCGPGAFEVLSRVDGRTTGETDAEAKCTKVQGYTKWFFYDSELDSLDFVLCLKER